MPVGGIASETNKYIWLAHAPPKSIDAFQGGSVTTGLDLVGTPIYRDITTGTRHRNSDLRDT